MKFSEVVGHKVLKEHIVEVIGKGRIPHAQLFLGTEGSGNLAMVMATIQYILCENKQNSDSCGECGSCMRTKKMQHPDIQFVFPIAGSDKATNDLQKAFTEEIVHDPYISYQDWSNKYLDGKQGGINVLQCTSALESISLKSYESPYKFLIFWYPEKLNIQSANKLLKTLEEPPARTIIFLVSCDEEGILQTIRSRCQLFRLKKITDFDMLEALQSQYEMDLDKARGIVNLADGDYSYARQLVEVENDYSEEVLTFRKWMLAAYKAEYKTLYELVDEFAKAKKEKQKAIIQNAMHVFRESLVANEDFSLLRSTNAEINFLTNFKRFVHADNIFAIIELLEECYYALERNGNSKIVFMHLSLSVGTLLRIPKVEA